MLEAATVTETRGVKAVSPEPLRCDVVRSRAALERLTREWTELYRRSATPNPFAHPAWVTAWLDHYSGEEELYVVTLRSGSRLVGLAPFCRSRAVSGGIGLRLAGAAPREKLTEIPEILIAGHPARKVLRVLVRFLLVDRVADWDWAELKLGPRQGWFESDWLPREAEARGARFTQTSSAAFVVVDLPADWSEFRSGLKRNVKEAIRRSANRLACVEDWDLVEPAGKAELEAALDSLVRLHALRSAVTDKERHPQYLASESEESFLRRASGRMFDAGAATLPRLRIGGEDAATRLVLRGNRSLFFSVSGLDPRFWDYGPGTMLMRETLRAAVARGDTSANLSMHPDESKLRWSERLEVHHTFLLVAPRRRARLAGAADMLLRSFRQGHALWR